MSFQREYLETVRIVKPRNGDVATDGVVNNLLTCIKTINNIIIS
jgi:hypothetical protein